MTRRLKIDDEGLFHVGQALQEAEHFRVFPAYLDLEDAEVVGFEEEPQNIKGTLEPRYVKIPCTRHAELHKLLDEFVYSLNNERAREAAEEKFGIGETLRTLDEYIDGTWEFSVFVAKKWLTSIRIEIVE